MGKTTGMLITRLRRRMMSTSRCAMGLRHMIGGWLRARRWVLLWREKWPRVRFSLNDPVCMFPHIIRLNVEQPHVG
jgi:hypothetical protein